MAEILRFGAEANLPPFESLDAVAARAAAEERFAFWNEEHPKVKNVSSIEIPGPTRKLRLRIYEPVGAPASGPGVLFLARRMLGVLLRRHARRLLPQSRLRQRLPICEPRLSDRTGTSIPGAARGLHRGGQLAGQVWRERGYRSGPPGDLGDFCGSHPALASCVAMRDRGQRLPSAAVLLYGMIPRTKIRHRTAPTVAENT